MRPTHRIASIIEGLSSLAAESSMLREGVPDMSKGEAANVAAAFILPRSDKSRGSGWGLVIPPIRGSKGSPRSRNGTESGGRGEVEAGGSRFGGCTVPGFCGRGDCWPCAGPPPKREISRVLRPRKAAARPTHSRMPRTKFTPINTKVCVYPSPSSKRRLACEKALDKLERNATLQCSWLLLLPVTFCVEDGEDNIALCHWPSCLSSNACLLLLLLELVVRLAALPVMSVRAAKAWACATSKASLLFRLLLKLPPSPALPPWICCCGGTDVVALRCPRPSSAMFECDSLITCFSVSKLPLLWWVTADRCKGVARVCR
mmetsp:Transcript_104415/g.207377  ORF Transcript_104415/g.207377 Transcript_104415/m.207377 type:complete len:317 (+) Transcript_104415:601-1551(+)